MKGICSPPVALGLPCRPEVSSEGTHISCDDSSHQRSHHIESPSLNCNSEKPKSSVWSRNLAPIPLCTRQHNASLIPTSSSYQHAIMQISFAGLALLLAASGASAQTTISKPAPGFVQAGAGPSYTKDVPLFAVRSPFSMQIVPFARQGRMLARQGARAVGRRCWGWTGKGIRVQVDTDHTAQLDPQRPAYRVHQQQQEQ